MTLAMTDNGKLLTCPFCGADELSHGWDRPGWDGRPMTGNVQCHNCDAFVLQDTEAEAIAAWNTRTTSGAATALVEALKRISTMRPAGDVATATDTRALVQQMEATALAALAAFTEQPARTEQDGGEA